MRIGTNKLSTILNDHVTMYYCSFTIKIKAGSISTRFDGQLVEHLQWSFGLGRYSTSSPIFPKIKLLVVAVFPDQIQVVKGCIGVDDKIFVIINISIYRSTRNKDIILICTN